MAEDAEYQEMNKAFVIPKTEMYMYTYCICLQTSKEITALKI